MLGLDNILSDEKLDRLEAMAAQTERAADKMQQASETALLAAVTMASAAEKIEEINDGSNAS